MPEPEIVAKPYSCEKGLGGSVRLLALFWQFAIETQAPTWVLEGKRTRGTRGEIANGNVITL